MTTFNRLPLAELDRISVVLPFLCIGSYGAAEQADYLEGLGITNTICLLEELPKAIPPQFENLLLPMSDDGESRLADLLVRAVPFIERARSSGGRVLIFCASGINRSPALASAYLQVVLRYRMDAALSMIFSVRPLVSIHERYLDQLAVLPKELPT